MKQIKKFSYVIDTRSKNMHMKLEHVELHAWHAFLHKFFSGTCFLHQTECSSIPCKFVQELVWTWMKQKMHEIWNGTARYCKDQFWRHLAGIFKIL